MKIPARCNRRKCQTRRNLSKRPQLYVNWPLCKMPRCGGKMYVDEYRLRKGPKDNPAMCKDDRCRHPLQYHRISNEGCVLYNDYVSERNAAPRSIHSPIAELDWVPF